MSLSPFRFAPAAPRLTVSAPPSRDRDPVADSGSEVDCELDLRKTRALDRQTRRELAAAQVERDVLGARVPVTTIVSVSAVVATPHWATPTMMRPAFAPCRRRWPPSRRRRSSSVAVRRAKRQVTAP